MSLLTAARDLLTFGANRQAPMPATEQRSIATTISPYLAGSPTYPTRDVLTYDTKGYRQLGLIFAAVTMTAEALASATVRVYDEAKDGATIPNHPMRLLLKRPNPEMEEARFLSMVAMIASVAGFCVVEKERSAAGRVVALWPLRSDWLTPVLKEQAPPDWKYRVPGLANPIYLDAADVLVFPYADRPDRSPFGIGPLEVCLREVGLLNRMTDFIKAFFDTGAVPFYGLIPDLQAGQTLNQQQVDDLAEGWVRRHGGLDNAVRPAILQGIKDIKRLSLDMNELAYTDLRDLSDLAIAQAFRIPASMLQIRVGLEHSDSRANAEVDEAKFYRQTITPLWRRFDGILSLNLLPEFPSPVTVSFEFDASKVQALQDDRNSKATWLVDGTARGVFSVHTLHRELGLPVPDGDDFWLRGIATEALPFDDPLGLTSIPPVAVPPAKEPPALPATTRATSRVDERRAKAGHDRELIARVARARTPSVRAFFAEQGRRIVPQVVLGLNARSLVHSNGHGPTEQRDAAEFVDWGGEDARLRAVVQRLHLLAGQTAFDGIAANYGLDIGINFDLANPNVKNVVDRLAHRVVDINATTRDDIASRVSVGLDAGLSTDEIASDLTGLFEETYANRATAIARTESLVSYGEASVLGFKESGVVDRAMIYDNPLHTDSYGSSDGLTCAERDQLVCPLDEAMDHIYADHPNGSAVATPVLTGEAV